MDVGLRVWRAFSANRIALVAGGATFYLLLSLFPALAAFVSLYGFVEDPHTIADHIAFLGGILPAGGVDIINSQLTALVQQDSGALSFGFAAGLAIALWSANNGIKGLFEGLNIAYGETEKRGFLMLNAQSLAFTAMALLMGIALIICVGVIPAALAFLSLEGWTETLIASLRWPCLVLLSIAGIGLLYRFGPSRERAKWRWLSWGAAFSALAWLAASWGFSYYLENFADYNATYGTLGAIIGFMMWTWISVVILLLGAQINAELEHQTAVDTTTGEAMPMGERGAVMADTLGQSASESE